MSTGSPSLCDTLSDLAYETWDLMSAGLARTGQREPDERVFTDHNFLHLERQHRPQVQMWLFSGSDEALTGADVEWWVGDGNHYVRMLVQAKRLNRKQQYSEVGADIGKSGIRQIERLLEVCEQGSRSIPGAMKYVGFTPVYLFYNGTSQPVGRVFDRCCSEHLDARERGCTVVHARTVFAALKHKRALPQHDIAGFVLPWRCMLCCAIRGGTAAERVAGALHETGLRSPPAVTPPQLTTYDLSDDEARSESAPSYRDEPPTDGGLSIQIWDRAALPFDPLTAATEPAELLAGAEKGWRPGGRLLMVTPTGADLGDFSLG
jgi:hypothetical protein